MLWTQLVFAVSVCMLSRCFGVDAIQSSYYKRLASVNGTCTKELELECFVQTLSKTQPEGSKLELNCHGLTSVWRLERSETTKIVPPPLVNSTTEKSVGIKSDGSSLTTSGTEAKQVLNETNKCLQDTTVPTNTSFLALKSRQMRRVDLFYLPSLGYFGCFQKLPSCRYNDIQFSPKLNKFVWITERHSSCVESSLYERFGGLKFIRFDGDLKFAVSNSGVFMMDNISSVTKISHVKDARRVMIDRQRKFLYWVQAPRSVDKIKVFRYKYLARGKPTKIYSGRYNIVQVDGAVAYGCSPHPHSIVLIHLGSKDFKLLGNSKDKCTDIARYKSKTFILTESRGVIIISDDDMKLIKSLSNSIPMSYEALEVISFASATKSSKVTKQRIKLQRNKNELNGNHSSDKAIVQSESTTIKPTEQPSKRVFGGKLANGNTRTTGTTKKRSKAKSRGSTTKKRSKAKSRGSTTKKRRKAMSRGSTTKRRRKAMSTGSGKSTKTKSIGYSKMPFTGGAIGGLKMPKVMDLKKMRKAIENYSLTAKKKMPGMDHSTWIKEVHKAIEKTPGHLPDSNNEARSNEVKWTNKVCDLCLLVTDISKKSATLYDRFALKMTLSLPKKDKLVDMVYDPYYGTLVEVFPNKVLRYQVTQEGDLGKPSLVGSPVAAGKLVTVKYDTQNGAYIYVGQSRTLIVNRQASIPPVRIDIVRPYEVEISPRKRRIYWLQPTRIKSIGYDNQSQKTVVHERFITGFALDPDGSCIYLCYSKQKPKPVYPATLLRFECRDIVKYGEYLVLVKRSGQLEFLRAKNPAVTARTINRPIPMGNVRLSLWGQLLSSSVSKARSSKKRSFGPSTKADSRSFPTRQRDSRLSSTRRFDSRTSSRRSAFRGIPTRGRDEGTTQGRSRDSYDSLGRKEDSRDSYGSNTMFSRGDRQSYKPSFSHKDSYSTRQKHRYTDQTSRRRSKKNHSKRSRSSSGTWYH